MNCFFNGYSNKFFLLISKIIIFLSGVILGELLVYNVCFCSCDNFDFLN